jgi:hypothetical protein
MLQLRGFAMLRVEAGGVLRPRAPEPMPRLEPRRHIGRHPTRGRGLLAGEIEGAAVAAGQSVSARMGAAAKRRLFADSVANLHHDTGRTERPRVPSGLRRVTDDQSARSPDGFHVAYVSAVPVVREPRGDMRREVVQTSGE